MAKVAAKPVIILPVLSHAIMLLMAGAILALSGVLAAVVAVDTLIRRARRRRRPEVILHWRYDDACEWS